jgi:hypothetical protein
MTLLLVLGSVDSAFGQDGSSSLIVEVVNSAGQPIKNACVTFVPRSGDIVFRKADRRGKVKVKRMVRGKYRVVVKVDGYEAQKKEIVVSEAKDTLAFVMKARNQE